MLSFIALLFTVTAAFAYANHYLLGLPRTTGLLLIALVVSGGAIALDAAFVPLHLTDLLRGALERIDFPGLLLHGALGFLLFAGALEVDAKALFARKWTILALATVGVAISTVLIAAGMWAIFRFLGLDVPVPWCLAFGALISPTDPVAIVDKLKQSGISPALQAVTTGESLFNDGIAIVLFTVFLRLATGTGEAEGPGALALDLARELGGGAALGLATGSIAYFATKGIDEYNIELLISLALVTGTYGIAEQVGVSGPVAVVVAGLLMGSVGVKYAVSKTTHDYLSKFWSLIEELLNSLLFLLLGFQFAILALEWQFFLAAGLAIPLALAVRFISIAIPAVSLNINAPHKLRAITLLTWGGLRGGIAVALALSLPGGEHQAALLTVTYGIVLFTMLVQGLTLEPVACALFPRPSASPDRPDET